MPRAPPPPTRRRRLRDFVAVHNLDEGGAPTSALASPASYGNVKFAPDGAQSVVSELTGSVVRQPTKACYPHLTKGSATIETWETEATSYISAMDAAVHSVLEGLRSFCSRGAPAAAEEEESAPPSKGEREQALNETFVGKMISCHAVDTFTCNGCACVSL